MTFEQPKTEQKDPVLESFHREIQKLKEEEERQFEEKGGGSVHFRGLNPEELTGEDAAIYEKFKNLELTEAEFYDWRRNITFELGKKAPAKSAERDEFFARDPRYIFMQYVANKIGFWQVWEEKRKEFELFRQEMKRRKEEEIEKMERKESYDPHLVALNPQKLAARDMEIFCQLEAGSLKDSSEDFRKYRSEIFRECQEYFCEEVAKHKKLKEIVSKPAPEGKRSPEHDEALQRFLAIFSRSNFLALVQNAMFEAALRESRERRQQKKEKIVNKVEL